MSIKIKPPEINHNQTLIVLTVDLFMTYFFIDIFDLLAYLCEVFTN